MGGRGALNQTAGAAVGLTFVGQRRLGGRVRADVAAVGARRLCFQAFFQLQRAQTGPPAVAVDVRGAARPGVDANISAASRRRRRRRATSGAGLAGGCHASVSHRLGSS